MVVEGITKRALLSNLTHIDNEDWSSVGSSLQKELLFFPTGHFYVNEFLNVLLESGIIFQDKGTLYPEADVRYFNFNEDKDKIISRLRKEFVEDLPLQEVIKNGYTIKHIADISQLIYIVSSAGGLNVNWRLLKEVNEIPETMYISLEPYRTSSSRGITLAINFTHKGQIALQMYVWLNKGGLFDHGYCYSIKELNTVKSYLKESWSTFLKTLKMA